MIVVDSDIKCRNVWPGIKSVTQCRVALLETDLCLCLVFATAATYHNDAVSLTHMNICNIYLNIYIATTLSKHICYR